MGSHVSAAVCAAGTVCGALVTAATLAEPVIACAAGLATIAVSYYAIRFYRSGRRE